MATMCCACPAALRVTRTTLPTLDQTRKLARLEFDGVPARLIGSPGDAAAVLADRDVVRMPTERHALDHLERLRIDDV